MFKRRFVRTVVVPAPATPATRTRQKYVELNAKN